MGGLMELSSAAAVQEFLRQHRHAVVTFSAHWCGPCNRSKPALQDMATRLSAEGSGLDIQFGIVYESDLGEAIHEYRVRAFPTYVLFQQQREVERVEGADLEAVEQMIRRAGCQKVWTGGATLGGSGETAVSPQEARLARLAKLEANSATKSAGNEPAPQPPAATEDVPMPDANRAEFKAEVDAPETAAATEPMEEEKGEPTSEQSEELQQHKFDPESITTLTEAMGFPLIRAQKGLLYGNGGTVEGAVDWLMQHQDDEDIDEPIPPKSSSAGAVAQSYKCNECGKILSNMANLELHANKTGHSDFEESTQHAKVLTAEEKATKIAEIKSLLKAKRAEREEKEKDEEKEREKQRRFMGKEMLKTREQLEQEQRKRDAMLRKKEKEEERKERERIRAEIAKDKAERQANKGKLGSKLGVEGYRPDGIQYDLGGAEGHEEHHQPKKVTVNLAKIDEYIHKVSSYKAGGDGGKCLKILKAYVGNLVDNPTEERYKSINMENNVYKTKIKPFIGAKSLLLAVGFQQTESGDSLVLKEDADLAVLASTKEKLEAALIAYG